LLFAFFSGFVIVVLVGATNGRHLIFVVIRCDGSAISL
jgi:hypothetical protein